MEGFYATGCISGWGARLFGACARMWSLAHKGLRAACRGWKVACGAVEAERVSLFGACARFRALRATVFRLRAGCWRLERKAFQACGWGFLGGASGYLGCARGL